MLSLLYCCCVKRTTQLDYIRTYVRSHIKKTKMRTITSVRHALQRVSFQTSERGCRPPACTNCLCVIQQYLQYLLLVRLLSGSYRATCGEK